MEYRKLGNSGLKVSVLSFGTWKTFRPDREEEAYCCMTAARDGGVNYFDTAEQYEGGQSEVIMGKVLNRWFKNHECKRSDVVISTKLFWDEELPKPSWSVNRTGLSRKHIIEGIQNSLKRLQLDYVDITYCHRYDANTPLEEVVRAMNYIIEKGYTFYWGTSKWPVEKIEEVFSICDHYIPLFEPPYSLGISAYGPLAGGILTGKYLDGIKEGRLADIHNKELKDRVEHNSYGMDIEGLDNMNKRIKNIFPICESLSVSPSLLSLAWILKNTHISTITFGASSIQQVQENLKCLEVYKLLTPEIMNQIEQALYFIINYYIIL
ncbi:hypothetical protein WA158_001443 [Blastocystis sp. Blastoise]